MTDMEKKIMARLCGKIIQYADLEVDTDAENLIQWVILNDRLKKNNNEIRGLIGEYKRLEEQEKKSVLDNLKRNQEVCKRRDELYQMQLDLRDKIHKLERDLLLEKV